MNGRIKDLTGQRFGRLTVTGLSELQAGGKAAWGCVCDCGKMAIVRGDHLRSGRTTSCGCFRREATERTTRRYDEGEGGLRSLYASYVRRAKRKGYAFELTFHEFSLLTALNCYYCGAPPEERHLERGRYAVAVNGVDRRDNRRGYVKNNVVPCCGICNRAKNALSTEDWETWLGRIVAFRGTK